MGSIVRRPPSYSVLLHRRYLHDFSALKTGEYRLSTNQPSHNLILFSLQGAMGSLTAPKEKTRQTATTTTTTTTTSDVVMVELFQVMSHCIGSKKDSDNNDFKIQGMNSATVIGSAPTALTSSTAQIKVPMSHVSLYCKYCTMCLKYMYHFCVAVEYV